MVTYEIKLSPYAYQQALSRMGKAWTGEIRGPCYCISTVYQWLRSWEESTAWTG